MKYRSKEELAQAKEQVLTLLQSGNSALFIATYTGEHLSEVQRWQKQYGIFPVFRPVDIGKIGEKLVCEHLCKLGFTAELMPVGHSFDVQVGHLRIEVKTCASVGAYGRQKVLNFHTRAKRNSLLGHTYQKNYRDDCDFLIATWLKDPAPMFWVLPASEIPGGLTIDISSYPEKSRKYAAYEGRFDLISQDLEMAVAA